MASVVGAALGYILRSLKSPSAAGTSTESLSVGIINLVGTVRVIARGFDQIFTRLRSAWTHAESDANNIGTIVRDTAQWDSDNWMRLTGVILPNSQSWAIGAVHRWADATFLRLSWLKSKQWTTVRDQAGTGYTFWQANHDFLHAFRRTSWPTLQRWQSKYANPQLAQLWTLNPNAWPLESVILDKAASYLHSKRGHGDLRGITALVIDESPQLWRHVEAAVLAWLQTEMT